MVEHYLDTVGVRGSKPLPRTISPVDFEPVKNDPSDPSVLGARNLVLVLALLAAAHVIVFSAALPFFNNMDEEWHLDLVSRYAQGDVPRKLEPLRPESLRCLAVYGTTEYLFPSPGGHVPTPPWKLPAAELQARVLAYQDFRRNDMNNELAQPPLYYTLAGLWMRLWQGLGVQGAPLLYRVRFFNALAVFGMVWLGGIAARKIFPDNRFLCLAVPALIAFMPQSVFYAINNDVLCPVVFGWVFILLLQWREQSLTPRLAIFLGLALASVFLTKHSSLPLLAVAGGWIAQKLFRDWRRGQASGAASLLLIGCAGLPMAAWMGWCKIHFDDFLGSGAKISVLGWTDKPVGEWLNHPIFTREGCVYFLASNLSTFWQGELDWGELMLGNAIVDCAYWVLTSGFLVLTLCACLRPASSLAPAQRAALGFSFACVAAVVAFLALLSIKYDFHSCPYPSRAHPFFTSGRLMLGMLIPFMILFACGLDQMLGKMPPRTRFLALSALLAFMVGSEITIDWNVFQSQYNWFHL